MDMDHERSWEVLPDLNHGFHARVWFKNHFRIGWAPTPFGALRKALRNCRLAIAQSMLRRLKGETPY